MEMKTHYLIQGLKVQENFQNIGFLEKEKL